MEFYTYRAFCTSVIDGDTAEFRVDLGFNVSVTQRFRFARIDAPEMYGVKRGSAEYSSGIISKNRVIELIENKDVIIKTDKDRTGKYGRYIAEIYVNEINVNDLLLEEGLAEKY